MRRRRRLLGRALPKGKGHRLRSERGARRPCRSPEGARRTCASDLLRLGEAQVALPTLVFDLDVLDGDGVPTGVEIRQRLELRDPAVVNEEAPHLLSGFVELLDPDVPSQVLERGRRAPLDKD